MTFGKTLATALVLGSATALGSGVALTTQASAQTAAPMTEEVSDAELTAFAQATLTMAEVREQYIAQIGAAETEAEQQALIEEGNAAMIGVLDDVTDITPERYFEINEAAQADADLNERIVMLLQEMSGEG